MLKSLPISYLLFKDILPIILVRGQRATFNSRLIYQLSMRDMMGNLTNEYIIALKIGCVLVPLQFVDNSKNKEVEIEGDPVAID